MFVTKTSKQELGEATDHISRSLILRTQAKHGLRNRTWIASVKSRKALSIQLKKYPKKQVM